MSPNDAGDQRPVVRVGARRRSSILQCRGLIVVVAAVCTVVQLVGAGRVDDRSMTGYGVVGHRAAARRHAVRRRDWSTADDEEEAVSAGDGRRGGWFPKEPDDEATQFARSRRWIASLTASRPGGRVTNGGVGKTWKRRSVLGLDNLEFAASMLDMARTQGQGPVGGGGGGPTSVEDVPASRGAGSGSYASGPSPVAPSTRGPGAMSIGPGGGLGGLGGGGGSPLGGRLMKVGHHQPPSPHGSGTGGSPRSHHGRLSMSVSPQELRKMMDMLHAGRR